MILASDGSAKIMKIELITKDFQLSDITLEDSYSFEDYLRTESNTMCLINLSIPEHRPFSSVMSSLEYRLFESSNPFLQNLHFKSFCEIEIMPSQEYLTSQDCEEIFRHHNGQLDDILKVRPLSSGRIIRIPEFDSKIKQNANYFANLYFSKFLK